jgi:hypothetical protein
MIFVWRPAQNERQEDKARRVRHHGAQREGLNVTHDDYSPQRFYLLFTRDLKCGELMSMRLRLAS